jgi:hypothetical protein
VVTRDPELLGAVFEHHDQRLRHDVFHPLRKWYAEEVKFAPRNRPAWARSKSNSGSAYHADRRHLWSMVDTRSGAGADSWAFGTGRMRKGRNSAPHPAGDRPKPSWPFPSN